MIPDTLRPFDLPEMQIALKTKLKVRIKPFPLAKQRPSDVAVRGRTGRSVLEHLLNVCFHMERRRDGY